MTVKIIRKPSPSGEVTDAMLMAAISEAIEQYGTLGTGKTWNLPEMRRRMEAAREVGDIERIDYIDDDGDEFSVITGGPCCYLQTSPKGNFPTAVRIKEHKKLRMLAEALLELADQLDAPTNHL